MADGRMQGAARAIGWSLGRIATRTGLGSRPPVTKQLDAVQAQRCEDAAFTISRQERHLPPEPSWIHFSSLLTRSLV
jgi:hypothetical protein